MPLWLNMRKKWGSSQSTKESQHRQLLSTKSKNQAIYDQTEVVSITRQGAAGPPEKAQCSRPAEDTQMSTRQGYVNPNDIKNEISVSFS